MYVSIIIRVRYGKGINNAWGYSIYRESNGAHTPCFSASPIIDPALSKVSVTAPGLTRDSFPQ